MPYRKLTSRDRSFIKGQTDRLLNEMNSNAAYLGQFRPMKQPRLGPTKPIWQWN